MRVRSVRKAGAIAGVAAAVASVVFVAGVALAQSGPSVPDFFWPYGQVQANGTNISPAVQPVLAFVNGQVCGSATTQVAGPGETTPASDVGKTVYVVNVLADGTGPGERPGCGHSGDPVSLYFPLLHAFASQRPAFMAGGERVDLQLTSPLAFRVVAGEVAADGS